MLCEDNDGILVVMDCYNNIKKFNYGANLVYIYKSDKKYIFCGDVNEDLNHFVCGSYGKFCYLIENNLEFRSDVLNAIKTNNSVLRQVTADKFDIDFTY